MPSGSYDAIIVLCIAIGHSDFTVPYLISASLICIDLLCRLYTDAQTASATCSGHHCKIPHYAHAQGVNNLTRQTTDNFLKICSLEVQSQS